MMKWDAIFFDCDGVILDSVDIKTKVFYQMYTKHGKEYAEQGVHFHLQNGGISRYEKFKHFYNQILKQQVSDETIMHLGEQFSDLVLNEVLIAPFIEGAYETISELRKMQIPSFVVSGTPHEEINYIFQKRNLDQFFIEIHGSPRIKPDIVQDILDRYSYRHTNCLFIGDALSDYEASVKTGLKFMGIEKEKHKTFSENVISKNSLSASDILNMQSFFI